MVKYTTTKSLVAYPDCEEDFFNPEPIRNMWEEHVSGKRRWHYYLWDVLMFQAWLEHWKL